MMGTHQYFGLVLARIAVPHSILAVQELAKNLGFAIVALIVVEAKVVFIFDFPIGKKSILSQFC